MKLIVEKSSWSGWNPNYKPKIEIEEFDDLKKIIHYETILKISVLNTLDKVEYNS